MRRGLSTSCVPDTFKPPFLSLPLAETTKPKKEKSRYEEDFLELEKLGRGGYGSVYKVQNKLDGLFYALKKIQFKNTSSQLLEKVLREVKTLALLNHPNIVRYHSAWKEEEDSSSPVHPDTQSSPRHSIHSTNNNLHHQILSKFKPFEENSDCWSYDDSESTPYDDEVDEDSFMEQFDPLKEDSCETASKVPILLPSPPLKSRKRPTNFLSTLTNITTLYIVMQLYTTNLSQWLETREGVDAKQNLFIFREICKGLQYIHSRGVIHRDLKPGNIFLSRSDETSPQSGEFVVCLGDFGLAIQNGSPTQSGSTSPTGHHHQPPFLPFALGSSSSSITPPPSLASSLSSFSPIEPSPLSSSFPSLYSLSSDSPMSLLNSHTSPLARSWEAKKHTSAVGTLTYSSPEQRYKGVYNEKTDIYSLGIIFFELYYTSSTKMEKARVLADLRNRILPSDFLKRYPTESAFILWLMSPNPEDRPSVDEILRHELLVDEFATVPRKDLVDMESTVLQQRALILNQHSYIQLLEQKLLSLGLKPDDLLNSSFDAIIAQKPEPFAAKTESAGANLAHARTSSFDACAKSDAVASTAATSSARETLIMG